MTASVTAVVVYVGSVSGVHPDSIRSTKSVSFQTPRIGKRLCSSLISPTGHSFSPSQNHQISTFFVSGLAIPSLNSGNGLCFSGIGALPTIDTPPPYALRLPMGKIQKNQVPAQRQRAG